jgi:hypothetical protein
VRDFDGKISIIFVLSEFPLDYILLPNQDDLNVQTPGRANRPFNFGFWGVVSAHCIHRNGQHLEGILFLLDFNNFPALVLPAMGAHAVRLLGLVAVRALRHAGPLQGIVRAPVASAPLGVSTFRIRHISPQHI